MQYRHLQNFILERMVKILYMEREGLQVLLLQKT